MGKRRLFILGAGSFGREAEGHLEMIPSSQREWEIAGFLDDSSTSLDGFPSDYSILGRIQGFSFRSDDLALVAVSSPEGKEKIFKSLRGKVEFLTYIAPDAIIGKFAEIGEGCFLGPKVILGPNVRLGDGVFVNSGSMVGHDVTIGPYTSLMANNNIAGNCAIGSKVFFASSVTVIPKRRICDGCYIGAGSVVIQHLKKKCTVFGNPAKRID